MRCTKVSVQSVKGVEQRALKSVLVRLQLLRYLGKTQPIAPVQTSAGLKDCSTHKYSMLVFKLRRIPCVG